MLGLVGLFDLDFGNVIIAKIKLLQRLFDDRAQVILHELISC
jgi:hypothetical protein